MVKTIVNTMVKKRVKNTVEKTVKTTEKKTVNNNEEQSGEENSGHNGEETSEETGEENGEENSEEHGEEDGERELDRVRVRPRGVLRRRTLHGEEEAVGDDRGQHRVLERGELHRRDAQLAQRAVERQHTTPMLRLRVPPP